MPRNIEIKARARNFTELKARATEESDTPVRVIPQDDTFFHVPNGRLKLRLLQDGEGELIFYQRTDQEGPKCSNYHIFRTPDPENLKRVLELAYGIRGCVRKTRYLFLVGQTRIHLDDVQGLGHFLELEVVMRDDQTDAEGQQIAQDLMMRLGVETGDLLEGAYMDMLEK